MNRGERLYHLQCLDSEDDVKKRRLAEVEAALRQNEALLEARRAVEAMQTQVRKLTARQQNLELELKGLGDKISASEQRLYSGVLKNPKEMTDLEAEVTSLKRRRQKLEDELLETMIAREEAEEQLALVQKRLQSIEAEWSARQAELTSEQQALRARLEELNQARQALLPYITEDDLAVYHNLRRRKGGLAVVCLQQDDTCGGCGVMVSPGLKWQLRLVGVGYCGNCERIIVQVQ
jgi:predicted  nucleic acid-binding Zn-ribbon protein